MSASIKRLRERAVVDIAEKILREPAIRNRGVFDWLRGEKGTRLRVDAFFEKSGLVLEYQGKQHFSPNRFMDRREGRREQRLRYDELRRRLIPRHGYRLLEIGYDEDISERIIRDKLKVLGL